MPQGPGRPHIFSHAQRMVLVSLLVTRRAMTAAEIANANYSPKDTTRVARSMEAMAQHGLLRMENPGNSLGAYTLTKLGIDFAANIDAAQKQPAIPRM